MSVIGFDSTGQQTGRITGVLPSLFRDPTNETFILPWVRWDGDRYTTVIELFDAASGASVAAIDGHIETQGPGADLAGALDASVTSDRRWLVVLHKIVRESGAPGPKGPKASGYSATQTLGIELVDLQSRQSVDYQVLQTVDRATVIRDVIRCSPDTARAYVLGRRLSGASLAGELWSFDLATARLARRDRSTVVPPTDKSRRSVLPDPSLPRQDWAIVASIGKLVAYEAPTLRVYAIPGLELQVETELSKLPTGSRFPPRPYPVFNVGAGLLHVADPSLGTLRNHELTQGRFTASRPVPGSKASPSLVLDLPREAVAISADGKRLFLADNRVGGSGLWVLDATDLAPIGNWLSGHDVKAIWCAADGITFALSKLEDRLYSVAPDGSVLAITVAQGATSFAAGILP